MTKILLLGLGRWGANHLRNLHSLPIELFVAETDSKRLEPARKIGVPESHLVTRYQDAIGCIDAAVVVTPAQTHFPICQEFLAAGKDVFVEKPITLTSQDARTLAELADKNKRILQVGHIFRFDPAVAWLKNAVQSGQVGHVKMMRSSFGGFKRPRNDSGITFADSIHFVDLFNYLLGRSPVRAQAIMQDFLGRGMDDASIVSLEYESPQGMTWATVEANYYVPGKTRDIVIVGSEMTIVCDLNATQNKIKTYVNKHVKEGAEYKAVEGAQQVIETPVEEPLKAELQAFANSVQTREPARADGWAGYESVRALEAAMESVRTGQKVALK